MIWEDVIRRNIKESKKDKRGNKQEKVKKRQNKGNKLIYCYGNLWIHLVMICDQLFSHSPTELFDGLGDWLCY
jgi:hypothetical protein